MFKNGRKFVSCVLRNYGKLLKKKPKRREKTRIMNNKFSKIYLKINMSLGKPFQLINMEFSAN